MQKLYSRLVPLSSQSEDFLPRRNGISPFLISPAAVREAKFQANVIRKWGLFSCAQPLLICLSCGTAETPLVHPCPSSGGSGFMSGKASREDYGLLFPFHTFRKNRLSLIQCPHLGTWKVSSFCGGLYPENSTGHHE